VSINILCAYFLSFHLDSSATIRFWLPKANTYATQSKLAIEDIVFKNFKGVTSGKRDPDVGMIVCSSPDVSARTAPVVTPYLTCTGLLKYQG
jgi:hypothetical protein